MSETFGNKKPQHFYYPNPQNIVKAFRGESLFIVGSITSGSLCFGVGTVERIMRGDDFDLVYMRFSQNRQRKILVSDPIARKQIFTLKLRHYAEILGFLARVDDNHDLFIVAKALQGWETPVAYDRKHFKDLDMFREMKDNERQEGNDILSTFEKK